MCNDLNEYDPFVPTYILVEDGSEYIDTSPMTDEDWEEWLANE